MECDRDRHLDSVFLAIADPTRRAILERLSLGSATVTEVARPFSTSLNSISKHIKVLERAGLVRRERVWREQHISLFPDGLSEAATWLAKKRAFWEERLDALENAVAKTKNKKRNK